MNANAMQLSLTTSWENVTCLKEKNSTSNEYFLKNSLLENTKQLIFTKMRKKTCLGLVKIFFSQFFFIKASYKKVERIK